MPTGLERAVARVSILTRPEGRVQQGCDGGSTSVVEFQSSPVPKDGCNVERDKTQLRLRMVSILTRPEGRVQLTIEPLCAWNDHVSILTRPEGRVQRSQGAASTGLRSVSILTRPEGRVQLPGMAFSPGVHYVSILTRPEGRVQPAFRGRCS